MLRGYSFNRQSDVFKDYIEKVYNIKSNPSNVTQKSIAKSLLNNLLGRFGINLEKPTTEMLTRKNFESKMSMYKIMSYKEVAYDKILVSYIPRLDYDIISSHNLDFIKIVNKYKDLELKPLNITSIPISAAVTAYSRIHMSKLKLEILRKGGKLYYSDTDSLVTDIELPNTMVSSNELGKLKLEHKIDEAIFISGKTYWLRDSNGKSFNKAKGIKSSSLSYIHYLILLNGLDVTNAIKSDTRTDWSKGEVVIKDKENITIHSDCYTKRVKIYDIKDKWVDTRPIIVNDIDRSLVVYVRKYLILFDNKQNINARKNIIVQQSIL